MLDRFWNKVDKSGSCWEWTACIRPDGYGVFGLNKVVVYAHRVAYELTRGPIPSGLEIDHLCRNRSCVNPDHLEVVNHKENMARGIHATKTHCKNGHKFTLENTYTRPSRPGTRECKVCKRANNTAWRRAHKEDSK